MARPEGNTTDGNSILSTELNGKRQEILMELLPEIRHMAALADTNTSTSQHLQMLQQLTRARGVDLSVYRCPSLKKWWAQSRGEKFRRWSTQRVGMTVLV